MENLEQYIQEYRSIQVAKHHLENLNKRLSKEQNRLAALEGIIEDEYKDIVRFERIPLKKLFNNILGDLDEKLELERQEYLLAVLQYRECKEVVELLKYEKNVIEFKLKNEATLERQMDYLFQKRRDQFLEKFPTIKNELLKLVEELDKHIALIPELEEAIAVCKLADIGLVNMINYLKKAKEYENWGTNFALVKKGKKIKASYIDKAQAEAHRLKPIFQNLEDELRDIFAYQSIVQVTRFEELQHFNDIYYDRLISDWIIKKEIFSSLNSIHNASDSVQRIKMTLAKEYTRTSDEIKLLQKKKKELILIGLDA